MSKKIKSFLLMNIGIALMALGIYFFKIPNGFSTGGVTGIGTILAQFTPISPGAWIWILNITLLFFGVYYSWKGYWYKNSVLQYDVFCTYIFV